MKVLECSTKGDRRFSALYARVMVNGKIDTIENWYQLSKRFGDEQFLTAKEVKHYQHLGNSPSHFVIGDAKCDVGLLSQFYKLLWVKYLDCNPGLVEYAKNYDKFHDCFRNANTINCQADVIEQYVKRGRESVISDCAELIEIGKGW